jgi:Uma2 family endonuclease
MSSKASFPDLHDQLAERLALSTAAPVRLVGSQEEYWQLVGATDYRLDYYQGEIIASMSYESEDHSEIASNLNFLLQAIYADRSLYRLFNSNRPVCIPACGHAVFNPDGCVALRHAEPYQYQAGMTAELSPVLLLEILSPSTRVRDWGEKLPCYKQIPSLNYILYLESTEARLTLMERVPASGQWLETTFTDLADLVLVAGQPVALRAIYQGVF